MDSYIFCYIFSTNYKNEIIKPHQYYSIIISIEYEEYNISYNKDFFTSKRKSILLKYQKVVLMNI